MSVSERPYYSIGEVLGLLLEEFPDISISKIRFLEGQGLIDPERTASGYRKFYDRDLDRLRYILREQKDHYLPLKVIKERLEGTDGTPAAPTRPIPIGASWARLPEGEAPLEAHQERSDDTAAFSGFTDVDLAGTDPTGEWIDPTLDHPRPAGADGPSATAPGGVERVDPGPAAAATPTNGAGGVGIARPADPTLGLDRMAAETAPTTTQVIDSVPADTARGHAPTPAAASAPSTATKSQAQPSKPAPARSDAGATTAPAPEPAIAPAAAAGAPAPAVVETPLIEAGELNVELTEAEICARAAISAPLLKQLREYGLVEPTSSGGQAVFGLEALRIATAAGRLADHGLEARHLRTWKVSAEREATLFEQLVQPFIRQRNPASRRQAAELSGELSKAGGELRAALMRQALRGYLD